MFSHQTHCLLLPLVPLPGKVGCVACRNGLPVLRAPTGDSTDLREGEGSVGVPMTLLKSLSFSSRLEADYKLDQCSSCSRSQSVDNWRQAGH